MGRDHLPCLQDCPPAFPEPFGVRREGGQCLHGLLVQYLPLPAESPEWLCAQGDLGGLSRPMTLMEALDCCCSRQEIGTAGQRLGKAQQGDLVLRDIPSW